MKRLWLLGFFLFVVLVGAIAWAVRGSSASLVFETGKTLQVEVVQTTEGRERGLAGHAPLSDDQGMLFVWPSAEERGFWMKGMGFPIDIFWIRDGRIVGMEQNVPVLEDTAVEPPIFLSPEDVDMVLETAAGFADRHGIAIGQTLQVLP